MLISFLALAGLVAVFFYLPWDLPESLRDDDRDALP